MISNKFLCYQTTEEFLKEVDSIADTSIVFVLDKGFLYTHGVIFFDPKIKEVILHALGYLEDRISENEKTVSTAINELLKEKVDKVEGMGLSSNDFSDAEKSKLAGIAAGAQVNTVVSVAGKTGTVTLGKSDVGLGNVDNTSDANKPISTATQTALNGKVDKVSGKGLSTNDYTTDEKNKLAGIASGAQVNTVTSVAGKTGAVSLSKSDVSLGNVDNTSDANKPISTATQTALNNKVDKVSGKGLSTNDYTTTEKNKLAGIESGAQVNKVTSVAGKTGAVIIEDKDIGYTGEISSKALGSLKSRIDNLEGAMGIALTELQLEIKKLKG